MKRSLSGLVLIIVLLSVCRQNVSAFDLMPAIAAPEFIIAPEPEGTSLELQVYSNEEGIEKIEIWQREEGVEEYHLVHEAPGSQVSFWMQNLNPRTTYEFRARLYRSGEYSPYSYVSHTTYSDFYSPEWSISESTAGSVLIEVTDRSYADVSYSLFKKGPDDAYEQLVETFNLPDSGSTYEITDSDVMPNVEYTYTLESAYENPRTNHYRDSKVFTTSSEPLRAPALHPQMGPVYGTTTYFDVYNHSGRGELEFYRSMGDTLNYMMFTPVPDGQEGAYRDPNLKPRTTYHYKVRVVDGEETSPFSDVLTLTTYSEFYPPTLTASITEEGYVKLVLKDNSYADLSYEIERDHSNPGEEYFYQGSVVMSDSGSTREFIDYTVKPNTTYRYQVNVSVEDEGAPFYTDVASATITTPEEQGDGELLAPALMPQAGPVYGTTIYFDVYNRSGRGELEFYRSMGDTLNYMMFTPVPDGQEGAYRDPNLNPRTTYHYKVRVVDGEETSPFSDVLTLTTYSEFYPPMLTASITEEGYVKLVLKDNSYADLSYEIERDHSNSGEEYFYQGSVVMSDSGSTREFIDYTVKPNTTYRYQVNVSVEDEGAPFYTDVASATITTPEEQGDGKLLAPALMPQAGPVYGTTIYFDVYNRSGRGELEFYRSMGDTLNYMIFTPVPDGQEGAYRDPNLKPRTTYHYKVRVVDGEETSPFSDVLTLTTYSEFYPPTLTASITEEGYVKLVLKDNSYADLSYEIERDHSNSGEEYFYEGSVVMSDSGSTREFIDYTAKPNTTYRYQVNVSVEDEGAPFYTDVASTTITTSTTTDGPMITGFLIVDPYNDMEVRALVDYDTIPYTARYNIVATATDDTESVEFFVNGKRFGENQVPYALFGDRHGNYHRGRLKPGDYELTATPYTGNLQKGKEGTTSVIHFTVWDDRDGGQGRASTFNDAIVHVDVFPNPVVSNATVEISAQENALVTIELRSDKGEILRIAQERVGSEGLMFKDWRADAVHPGLWYMVVKVDDKTITKRLIVK